MCVSLLMLSVLWHRICWSSFYNFNYFNNLRILQFVCISWKMKCLILLMHGATMKFQEKDLKGLKCYNFFMSATTTQLLSSGELCKLRYHTIRALLKLASANVCFCTNNSKMPNCGLRHYCRKWAILPLRSSHCFLLAVFLGVKLPEREADHSHHVNMKL